MGKAARTTEAAEATLAKFGVVDNPYVRALEDGSMPAEAFRRSQQQFLHAVEFFPRPMAALVSRLPDARQRMDLVHNLAEEHGDFREERAHPNTFRAFLTSVGARWPEKAVIGPAVLSFNCTLMGACVGEPVEVGISCMGVIELAFAGISARIGKAVVERGWVARDRLVHYALHAELDVEHAEEFFAVVERRWEDEEGRTAIVRGLELGAYAFERLYRAMLEGPPIVPAD
jgi:pyrroloquinoline-quinone synthase